VITWVPFLTPLVAVVMAATDGQGLEVYGPLGIALAGLAWFMRELIKGIIERADRNEARIEKLTDQYMNQALPVMNNAIEVIKRREEVDRRILEALDRLG
jgi:hypothetical protein